MKKRACRKITGDTMMTETEALLNDFAYRSFFEVADGDYIAARMAYRAGLAGQFLWASQQALEKYLKYILLLNRIKADDVRHDLGKALSKIGESGKLTLNLSEQTNAFIQRLDLMGQYRYFEVPTLFFGDDIIRLDRAVWELRRYCTLDSKPRQAIIRKGFVPPRVRIPNGYLEQVIDDKQNLAREPLLWQNAFFGRARKKIRPFGGFLAQNSPLWLNPTLLHEVLKYVYIPKAVIAYESQKNV
jgi:HEPN domain-containing protein